jgi:hypothetical protein
MNMVPVVRLCRVRPIGARLEFVIPRSMEQIWIRICNRCQHPKRFTFVLLNMNLSTYTQHRFVFIPAKQMSWCSVALRIRHVDLYFEVSQKNLQETFATSE